MGYGTKVIECLGGEDETSSKVCSNFKDHSLKTSCLILSTEEAHTDKDRLRKKLMIRLKKNNHTEKIHSLVMINLNRVVTFTK
jgi:hypothetical protein